MIAEIITIAAIGLVCGMAGYLAGKRAGRNDVLKKLRVPDGCHITSVGYAKIK